MSTDGFLLDTNVLSEFNRNQPPGSTCASKIETKLGASAVTSFRLLLSKSWMGTSEQSDSVAGVLKKVFDYDLYLTKGLSPNWLETTAAEALKTLPQEIVKAFFYLVIVWLVLHLGLKLK